MAEINLPVKLQIQNLQSLVSELQSKLGNLKPDSSGYKNIERIIKSISNDIEKLAIQSNKPFIDESQFTKAERSVEQLEESIDKVEYSIKKIKFSDIKLTSGQQADIKAFEDSINSIKEKLKIIKSTAKDEFLNSALGQEWVKIDNTAFSKSLNQITNDIRRAVKEQKTELEELQAIAVNYQKALSENQRIKDFTNKMVDDPANGSDLFSKKWQELTKQLSDGTYKFKDGGKNLMVQWLESQLKLDSGILDSLLKKGVTASNIGQKLKELLNNELAKNEQVISLNPNVDTKVAQLEASYSNLLNILRQVGVSEEQVASIEQVLRNSLDGTTASLRNYENNLEQAAQNNEGFQNTTNQMRQQLDGLKTTLQQTNSQFIQIQRTQQSFNQMKMAVANFMGFNQVLNLTKTAVKEALNHIKELDTVMSKISIVTDMSTGDLWNQIDTYSKMAQSYGVSIKGAYEVSQIYYQQGLQTTDVLTLTNETLKLAKISGLDYATTTDYMTTALRGFKMEMSEASTVVDVYSNLASHTAVSQEELAVAMSKTASSMEGVGATFEEASAMIGTMVAVTRESATNIGSALKSIASRYGELTKDPGKLIDEEGEVMAFNKVDAALQSVGITMKTTDGQFREFTDVIIELGEKWEQLDSVQQRYIATQFAGNRQQSRFLALVSNVDLLKANIDYAENSEDTGTLQALKALDSIEAKMEQVKVAYQQFYTTVGAENVWKGLLDSTTNVINTLNGLPKLFGKIPVGAIAAVSSIITVIKTLGTNLITGFAEVFGNGILQGMLSAQNSAKAGTEGLFNTIITTIKGKLGIAKQAGEEISKSVAEGLQNKDDIVEKLTGKDKTTYGRNSNVINELKKIDTSDKFKINAAVVSLHQKGIINDKEFGLAYNNGAEGVKALEKALTQVNEKIISNAQALEDNKNVVKNWLTQHENGAKALQSFGSALHMASMMINNSEPGMKTFSGTLMSLSGIATLAGSAWQVFTASVQQGSLALNSIPWMAVISGIFAVINGISTIIITPEEKLKELEERAEKLNNEAKQEKSNYRNLNNSIKKLDELKEKRYESAEAAEEYQSAVDSLAEKFPQLVAGFDESGNIILDLTNQEHVLAQARIDSANATYKAAQAELDAVEQKRKNSKRELVSKGQVQSTITSSLSAQGQLGAARRKLISSTFEEGIDINVDYERDVQSSLRDFVIKYSNLRNELITSGNEEDLEELEDSYGFLKNAYDHFGAFSYQALKTYLNSLENDLTYEEQQIYDLFFSDYDPEKLINNFQNAQEQFNKTIASDSSSEKEIADAYTALYNAFNPIKNNTLKLFNTDEIKAITKELESASEQIKQYGIASDLYKSDQKLVISAWQNTHDNNGKAWTYLSESATMASILTEQIIKTIGENESYIDAEERLGSTVWVNLQHTLETFWKGLNLSDRSKFNEMLGNKAYNADMIISKFNLNDSTIASWLIEHYQDLVLSIHERLTNQLKSYGYDVEISNEGIVTTTEANTFIQEYVNKINSATTDYEEIFLTNSFKQYENLLQSGFSDQAYKYGVAALEVFKNIQALSTQDLDVYSGIITSLDKYNLNTKTGIEDFISYIESTDTKIDDDGLKTSLETLKSTLSTNISLTIQSLTSQLVSGWSETSKTLTKLTSGIELSDVENIINQAKKYKDVDISFSDFQTNGDKLVLVNEKAAAYWQAYFDEQNKKIDTVKSDLDLAARSLLEISETETIDFSKLSKIGVEDKINSTVADLYKTILGSDFDKYFKSIVDDEKGATGEFQLIKDIPNLSEIIQKAYENNIELTEEYKQYVAWQREQVEQSYEFTAGNYSKTGKKIPELHKLASGEMKIGPQDYVLKAAKDSINEAYNSLISDVLSKGFKNINLSDYSGLISGAMKSNLEIILKEGNYQDFVKTYASWAGKSVDEINDLLVQAIEKDREKLSEDLIKDLTFVDKDTFYATADILEKLANAWDVPLQKILAAYNDTYNAVTGEYTVNVKSLFDEFNIDLDSVNYFEETVQESVDSLFNSLASDISKALSGGLDTQGITNLRENLARMYGTQIDVDQISYVKTPEGLKMTEDGFFSLYKQLSGVDKNLARKIIPDLAKMSTQYSSLQGTLKAYEQTTDEARKAALQDLASHQARKPESYNLFDNNMSTTWEIADNFYGSVTKGYKITNQMANQGKVSASDFSSLMSMIMESSNAQASQQALEWMQQAPDFFFKGSDGTLMVNTSKFIKNTKEVNKLMVEALEQVRIKGQKEQELYNELRFGSESLENYFGGQGADTSAAGIQKLIDSNTKQGNNVKALLEAIKIGNTTLLTQLNDESLTENFTEEMRNKLLNLLANTNWDYENMDQQMTEIFSQLGIGGTLEIDSNGKWNFVINTDKDTVSMEYEYKGKKFNSLEDKIQWMQEEAQMLTGATIQGSGENQIITRQMGGVTVEVTYVGGEFIYTAKMKDSNQTIVAHSEEELKLGIIAAGQSQELGNEESVVSTNQNKVFKINDVSYTVEIDANGEYVVKNGNEKETSMSTALNDYFQNEAADESTTVQGGDVVIQPKTITVQAADGTQVTISGTLSPDSAAAKPLTMAVTVPGADQTTFKNDLPELPYDKQLMLLLSNVLAWYYGTAEDSDITITNDLTPEELIATAILTSVLLANGGEGVTDINDAEFTLNGETITIPEEVLGYITKLLTAMGDNSEVDPMSLSQPVTITSADGTIFTLTVSVDENAEKSPVKKDSYTGGVSYGDTSADISKVTVTISIGAESKIEEGTYGPGVTYENSEGDIKQVTGNAADAQGTTAHQTEYKGNVNVDTANGTILIVSGDAENATGVATSQTQYKAEVTVQNASGTIVQITASVTSNTKEVLPSSYSVKNDIPIENIFAKIKQLAFSLTEDAKKTAQAGPTAKQMGISEDGYMLDTITVEQPYILKYTSADKRLSTFALRDQLFNNDITGFQQKYWSSYFEYDASNISVSFKKGMQSYVDLLQDLVHEGTALSNIDLSNIEKLSTLTVDDQTRAQLNDILNTNTQLTEESQKAYDTLSLITQLNDANIILVIDALSRLSSILNDIKIIDISDTVSKVEAIGGALSANDDINFNINADLKVLDKALSKLKQITAALSMPKNINFKSNIESVISSIESALDRLVDTTRTIKIIAEIDGPGMAKGSMILGKGSPLKSNLPGRNDFITTTNEAKSQGTLMGELGPELYVTHGHYFIAGQNGAEFVNLPDDAIVFNHLQTERLLKNGWAGHGRPVSNERKAAGEAHAQADKVELVQSGKTSILSQVGQALISGVTKLFTTVSKATVTAVQTIQDYQAKRDKDFVDTWTTKINDINAVVEKFKTDKSGAEKIQAFIDEFNKLDTTGISATAQKKIKDLYNKLIDDSLAKTVKAQVEANKKQQEAAKAQAAAAKASQEAAKAAEEAAKAAKQVAENTTKVYGAEHDSKGIVHTGAAPTLNDPFAKYSSGTSVSGSSSSSSGKGNSNSNSGSGNSLNVTTEQYSGGKGGTGGKATTLDAKALKEAKSAVSTFLSDLLSKGIEAINLNDYEKIPTDMKADLQKKIDNRDSYTSFITEYGIAMNKSVQELNSTYIEAFQKDLDRHGLSQTQNEAVKNLSYYNSGKIGGSAETWTDLFGNYALFWDAFDKKIIDWNDILGEYIATSEEDIEQYLNTNLNAINGYSNAKLVGQGKLEREINESISTMVQEGIEDYSTLLEQLREQGYTGSFDVTTTYDKKFKLNNNSQEELSSFLSGAGKATIVDSSKIIAEEMLSNIIKGISNSHITEGMQNNINDWITSKGYSAEEFGFKDGIIDFSSIIKSLTIFGEEYRDTIFEELQSIDVGNLNQDEIRWLIDVITDIGGTGSTTVVAYLQNNIVNRAKAISESIQKGFGKDNTMTAPEYDQLVKDLTNMGIEFNSNDFTQVGDNYTASFKVVKDIYEQLLVKYPSAANDFLKNISNEYLTYGQQNWKKQQLEASGDFSAAAEVQKASYERLSSIASSISKAYGELNVIDPTEVNTLKDSLTSAGFDSINMVSKGNAGASIEDFNEVKKFAEEIIDSAPLIVIDLLTNISDDLLDVNERAQKAILLEQANAKQEAAKTRDSIITSYSTITSSLNDAFEKGISEEDYVKFNSALKAVGMKEVNWTSAEGKYKASFDEITKIYEELIKEFPELASASLKNLSEASLTADQKAVQAKILQSAGDVSSAATILDSIVTDRAKIIELALKGISSTGMTETEAQELTDKWKSNYGVDVDFNFSKKGNGKGITFTKLMELYEPIKAKSTQDAEDFLTQLSEAIDIKKLTTDEINEYVRVIKEAHSSGKITTEQMNKMLAPTEDAILERISNTINIIKNGITGSAKKADINTLKDNLKADYGLSDAEVESIVRTVSTEDGQQLTKDSLFSIIDIIKEKTPKAVKSIIEEYNNKIASDIDSSLESTEGFVDTWISSIEYDPYYEKFSGTRSEIAALFSKRGLVLNQAWLESLEQNDDGEYLFSMIEAESQGLTFPAEYKERLNKYLSKQAQDRENQIYTGLSNAISTVLEQGFDAIDFRDYFDLPSEVVDDIKASAELSKRDFVAKFAIAAGKTVSEANSLYFQAWEKDVAKEASDAAKGMQYYKSGAMSGSSSDWTSLLGDTIKVSDLVAMGLLTYNEALDTYITNDIEAIKRLGLSDSLFDENAIKDSIREMFNTIVDTFGKAITDGLTNLEIAQFQEQLHQQGIDLELTFKQTVDGLKLSDESAIKLYNTLKQVDGIAASLTFRKLNEELKESNEHYKTIFSTQKRILELQEKINEADAETSNARIEQYKEELSLAKEILATRATEKDDSLNFMNNELTGALNNPFNLAANIKTAMEAYREALSPEDKNNPAGFMDYTQLSNWANFANSIASEANVIEFAGHKLNGSLESLESLMVDAASSLSVVDGELKVSLEKMGTDLKTGLTDAAASSNAGLKKFAKEQIKIIDGLITFFEMLVALGDIEQVDINGDKILDINEIFSDISKGIYTEKIQAFADSVLKAAETNVNLKTALENFQVNNTNLYNILEDTKQGINKTGISAVDMTKLYNSFYQLIEAGDFDPEHIAQSLQEHLNSLDFGSLTIKWQDFTITMLAGKVILETDKDGVKTYEYDGKIYSSIAEIYTEYNNKALEEIKAYSWTSEGEQENSIVIDLGARGTYTLYVDSETGKIVDSTGQEYNTMDDFWTVRTAEYNKDTEGKDIKEIDFKVLMQTLPEVASAEELTPEQVAELKEAGLNTGAKLEEAWNKDSHDFIAQYGFKLAPREGDNFFDEEGIKKLNELLADESKSVNMTLTLSDDSDKVAVELVSSKEPVSVKVIADTTEALELAEAAKKAIDEKKAKITVDITDNASSSISQIYQDLMDLDGSSATVKIYEETVSSISDSASAKGKARAKGTQTLMGELGPELYVSNGRYYVVGQGGAEFVNLPDDSIVFNHLQTEKLLKSGITGRGKPVTNERTAVSMAKGTGPAAANAKEILSTLKQLRAMWERIADLDISTLMSMRKSNENPDGTTGSMKSYIQDVEKWYNWLQKIAEIEKEINVEEAKRNKLMAEASRYNNNAKDYAKSQKETLKLLQEEAQVQKNLNDQYKQALDESMRDFQESPMSAFYRFDEKGQLFYKDGALDELNKLLTTDNASKPYSTPWEQYHALWEKDGGKYRKYMEYDGGTKIENDDANQVNEYYTNAVQAMMHNIDAEKQSYQSLWDAYNDSYTEYLNKLAEAADFAAEMNSNYFKIWEKQLGTSAKKAAAEIQYSMSGQLTGSSDAWSEVLKSTLNNMPIQVSDLVEQGIMKYNETLDTYVVTNLEALQALGLDSSIINPSVVRDSVRSLFNNITDTLSNAIENGITSVEKDSFIENLKLQGINLDLTFNKTVNGLKLSQESAIELYSELKKVDTISARLAFDKLRASLEETNDNYKTMTSLIKNIVDLHDKINDAEHYSDEKIKQYREELALAKEIAQVRATSEDSSFNFLDQDIPGAMNNPLNYVDNWITAWKELREATEGDEEKSINFQHMYNMLNEMNNLAHVTGNTLNFLGMTLDGSAETIDAAINKTINALGSDTSGGYGVLLSKLGTGLTDGVDSYAASADSAIHTMAKAQVEILDALIKVFEVIVAMEDFEAVDIDLNGILDLNEIFGDAEDAGEAAAHFTERFMTAAQTLSSRMAKDSEMSAAFEAVKVNGTSMKELIEDAADGVKNTTLSASDYQTAISVLYEMTKRGDFNLNDVATSLKDALLANHSNFEGTIEWGDYTVNLKYNVAMVKDKNGKYLSTSGTPYDTSEEALRASMVESVGIHKDNIQVDLNSETGEATATGILKIGKQEVQVIANKEGFTYCLEDGSTYANVDDAYQAIWKNSGTALGYDEWKIEEGITVVAKIENVDVSDLEPSQVQHAIGVSYQQLKQEWEDAKNSENSAQEILALKAKYGFEFTDSTTEEDWAKFKELAGIETKNLEINASINVIENGKSVMQILQNGSTGLAVETDTTKAKTDVEEVVKEISIPRAIPISGDTTQANADLQNLISTITSAYQSVIIDGDTTKGQNALNNLMNMVKNSYKSVTIDASTSSAVTKLQTIIDYIADITDKTVDITVNKTINETTNSSSSGSSSAKGTAMAGGSHVLMGELGPELYVSNGHYYIAGRSGAEFVDLPDDAIVFNHLQTQQLLENGNTGRGKPLTNELNAISFAHGSLGGDAFASAKETLNFLKQLRSMWQSLAESSITNLAGLGGSAAAGDDKNKVGAWLAEVERWYNLLQKIAQLEDEINQQEALRNKLQSDRVIDGEKYYQTQKDSFKNYIEQANSYREYYEQQQEYFNKRKDELNNRNSPLSAFYTFDENGQLKFKEGKYAELASVFAQNDEGRAKYTPQEQYQMLINMGFSEEFMKYDANGQLIENKDGDDQYRYDMVQAVYERMEQERTEMQSLHDSINDSYVNYLESLTKANELLQNIIDNQLAVEDKVLTAIEDREQAVIDELSKQRDTLRENSDKYIASLQNALSKERDLYSKNNEKEDLNKLRRQLAILQRSGGSASQINDLEKQIREKSQEQYFTAQEDQINTLKEASDAQLERLDTQISLMSETLAYEKEHGLLWNEVYKIMSGSSEEITSFITDNTSGWSEKSALAQEEELRTISSMAQQWTSFYGDQESIIKDAIISGSEQIAEENYSPADLTQQALTNNEIYENADPNKKKREEEARRKKEEEEKAKAAAEAREAKQKVLNSSRSEYASDEEYLNAIGEASGIKRDNYYTLFDWYDALRRLGISGVYEAIGDYSQNDAWTSKLSMPYETNTNRQTVEAVRTATEEAYNKVYSNNSNKISTKNSKANTNEKTTSTTTNSKTVAASTQTKTSTSTSKASTKTTNTASNSKTTSKTSNTSTNSNTDTVSLEKAKQISANNEKQIIDTWLNNIAAERVNQQNALTWYESMKTIATNDIATKKYGEAGIKDSQQALASAEQGIKQIQEILSALDQQEQEARRQLSVLGFSHGGIVDYTGLAMVHGSKVRPETFLNADETRTWKEDILSGNNNSLTGRLLQLSDYTQSLLNANKTINNSESESIIIEHAEVNMNVAKIADDYDARRAGENVLNEMLNIARKSGAQNTMRR